MSYVASVSSFNVTSNLPAPTRLTDQGPADPHVVVGTDALFGSQNFDPDALTPDALLTYLSTRLNSINDQTQTVLNRQKTSEGVRRELGEIQKILATLKTDEANKTTPITPSEEQKAQLAEIGDHIANIRTLNVELADRLSADLQKEGQVLNSPDLSYTTQQVEDTKEYLSTMCKDIESGAQMDMITLQSLMGARQTAIQLSTNLVAALNESMKAVVSNIR